MERGHSNLSWIRWHCCSKIEHSPSWGEGFLSFFHSRRLTLSKALAVQCFSYQKDLCPYAFLKYHHNLRFNSNYNFKFLTVLIIIFTQFLYINLSARFDFIVRDKIYPQITLSICWLFYLAAFTKVFYRILFIAEH